MKTDFNSIIENFAAVQLAAVKAVQLASVKSEPECPDCEGTGKDFYSCCGIDMRGNDSDLCPRCHEHTGWDSLANAEECTECAGTGKWLSI